MLRPLKEAKAETLGVKLGDLKTNILVKTLAFRLEVVTETRSLILQQMPKTRHVKTQRAVCRRKNYWTY